MGEKILCLVELCFEGAHQLGCGRTRPGVLQNVLRHFHVHQLDQLQGPQSLEIKKESKISCEKATLFQC